MQKIIALAIVALSGCAASGLERRLKDAEDENRFLRQQNAKRMQKPAEVQKPEPAPIDPYAGPAAPKAPEGTTVTQTVTQGVVSDTVAPEPAGYHCFLYRKPTFGTFFIKIVNGQKLFAIVPELDGRRVIVERPAYTASGFAAQPVGQQQVTILKPGEYCYIPVDEMLDPNGTPRIYVLTATAYAKSHATDGYVTVLNENPVGHSRDLTIQLSSTQSVTPISVLSSHF